jgi:hypothetical protein
MQTRAARAFKITYLGAERSPDIIGDTSCPSGGTVSGGVHGRRNSHPRHDKATDADLADSSRPDADRLEATSIAPWVRVLTGIMSLVAGGIFVCLGGWFTVRDVALRGDQPTADATVLEHHHSRGPGIIRIDVAFVTADGRHARVTIDEFATPVPDVGAIMQVRYDPDHPSWFARDVRQGPNVTLPVVSALMTLVAAFGFVFIALRGGRSPSSQSDARAATNSPQRPDLA